MERAPLTTPEREGDEGERRGGRKRKRVKGRKRRDRLDPDEQADARRDVGCCRRHHVHRGYRDRKQCGERRNHLRVRRPPKRCGPAMDAELPAGSVACRRKDVAPVLGDQPRRYKCHDQRNDGRVDVTAQATDEEDDQDREAEHVFVNAPTEDEHPRTLWMTLNVDHVRGCSQLEVGEDAPSISIRTRTDELLNASRYCRSPATQAFRPSSEPRV